MLSSNLSKWQWLGIAILISIISSLPIVLAGRLLSSQIGILGALNGGKADLPLLTSRLGSAVEFFHHDPWLTLIIPMLFLGLLLLNRKRPIGVVIGLLISSLLCVGLLNWATYLPWTTIVDVIR